ncbi:MAG TPA: copper resistance protein NlpE N-terminal domain-containing protein [Gillisia sp.]|nr:copper resistance protein NlpE N-terminal domain-containing protein [Gillisia sp.]
MKKILLLIFILFTVVACKSNVDSPDNELRDDLTENNKSLQLHNSRNSLDWAGTYSGILPCEDCIGVETILEIKEDETYKLISRRTNSEDQTIETQSSGNFIWNDKGSAITLEEETEMPPLKVGENYLVPLDPRGFEVRAEPGNNFKLLKL